ncbi:MAG: non-canonical purine NTP pyrophosphatase [Gemmatimonadaceae bacterium]
MRRVVLATRSAGKLAELRPIFEAARYSPLSLAELDLPVAPLEDAIECYATFEENAIAKGRYFFRRCGGLPVVADDSGLEVAALGNRPGVRSKRWSGRDDLGGAALDAANNAALIAALRSERDRSARYVCVAVWVDAHGKLIARGEAAGELLESPRGARGFGYDPYFLSHELGITFAEASRSQKEEVSHRGRAVRALLASLGERQRVS